MYSHLCPSVGSGMGTGRREKLPLNLTLESEGATKKTDVQTPAGPNGYDCLYFKEEAAKFQRGQGTHLKLQR